ncbi:MAG: chromophore lyase CpcT/CpeT [Thermoanaerobaculia bacterium]
MVFGLVLSLLVVPGGSASGTAPATADEVARWLAGTYDTREQSVRDAEVPALRMLIVTVPKSRLSFGAAVLYVEQAPEAKPDRPSLQRFLRIETDAEGAILFRWFDLKDGASAAGKWGRPADLALFGRDDVRERTACAVTLKKIGDHYEGSVSAIECAPPFLGAVRVSSEIRVFSDHVETWDRAFGAKGVQIFGPASGPYAWKKRSAVAPEEHSPAARERDE